MKKKFFLYHIIYIAFLAPSFGQQLELKIVGADSIETKKIDSIYYKKYHADFSSVIKEADSTFKKLVHKGYLECKIRETKRQNDSTFISTFSLGKKYDRLTIYHGSQFNRKDVQGFALKSTDSSFTIPMESTDPILKHLNELISNKGFPFATLKLTNLSVGENGEVFSNLEVQLKGEKRNVDRIVLRGYEKFPRSFIKRYLKIKEGTTLGIKDIQKKTGLLRDLRFASEIKPPEILFRNDSTILYLYFQKQKSNSFDGFLGFGTNDETNKLEFDGYLNLDLTNNLNYGESLQLYYKSDESKQRTFSANIQLPYLFKSPLGAELELQIFKKDTLFTTVNQLGSLFYQLNSRNRLSLGIESIQSNNLGEVSSVLSIQDYKTTLYSIGYLHKSLTLENNPLFPIKTYAFINLGIGNRSMDGEKQPQTKLMLDIYRIFNLNEKNHAFIRIKGSSLISDSFFENELFRFGGMNSIRGFEENSLSATSYGVISAEYRYLLSPIIFLHTITDFSYLENEIVSQKEKLYSFGFGFGVLTQTGLFRLIYANGKNENRNFRLSNSKVHLSLTAFF